MVSEVDEVLWDYLGDELLRELLTPPRVPTFARETERPASEEAS